MRDPRRASRRRAALVAALVAAQLGAQSVAALTSQSITFALPADGLVGVTVPLTGTASSGLPVSYRSLTDAICSIDGETLALVDQGTCTVVASQAGDAEYDPAPDVQASMLVKLPQSITFSLPANGLVGADVPLAGAATSGLAVGYESATPGICAVNGTTLDLMAPGTCEVTASQPGDDAWDAAADVDATMLVKLPPYTSPDGANLGRYAFNGTVVSLAIDQATGTTYVGGTFTQVGIRTGSIAVVDPPGSGGDQLQDDNPDVVANGVDVFTDDASGYFIAGAVGSINGDGIHRHGVIRMTADGGVDPTWKTDDPCDIGNIPTWDLGDRLAAQAEVSLDGTGYSTVGLAFVSKATGAWTFAGGGDAPCTSGSRVWPSIPAFGPSAACIGWNICQSFVRSAVEDQVHHVLLTEHVVISRQTLSNASYRIRHYLVAYDTAAGTRIWSRELEDPQEPDGWPDQVIWEGLIESMAVLDGTVLVRGLFPLEAVDWPGRQSTMLLLDKQTGSIVQRWNASGEQDLAEPSEIVAPPTTCVNPVFGGLPQPIWEFVTLDASTVLGYASHEEVPGGLELAVCAYTITGSGAQASLAGEQLGTFLAEPDPAIRYVLPSALIGGRYVTGGNGAFDLQTGSQVAGWNPEPSAAPQSVIGVGSAVVLGGNLVFTHGDPASHVAALDEDLAPIPSFSADLPDTENSGTAIQGVRQVALVDGKVVVAGDLKGTFGRGPLVALDPVTGDVLWSYAEAEPIFGLALAVDQATDSFYLGSEIHASRFLWRFEPDGNGFALDESFDHAIGALDGRRAVSGLAYVGGRLYIGGHFASVDGQARQGLARLTNGTLDAWAPKPIDELDPGPDDALELQPRRFVELGTLVVVSGTLWSIAPPNGLTTMLPSVTVYSEATGARVRPVGTNEPWYPDGHWAMDMVVAEDTLYVAFGGTGIGAFDAATLDYLPSRSIRTQPGWDDNAIWALGLRDGSVSLAEAGVYAPASGAAVGAVETTGVAADLTALVLGGDLDHWSNVTAGNVVETLPSERLTVTRAGRGKGTVTSQPAGISCGATCVFQFPIGASVKLTAAPVAGAAFTGWSGGGCSGTGVCTVSLTAARLVTATFADKAKPTVGTPLTSLRAGERLDGSSVRLRVSWTASDTGGSGIKRYEIARSTNGGSSWRSVSTSLTSPAMNVTVPTSGSVRYRVRAVDKAGNVGSWNAGPTLRPRLVQQSAGAIVYQKTWTSFSDTRCSGGTARYAKASGASATLTFTGRAIGFLTTTASNRGKANVYINGSLVATLDLRSSSTRFRVVAWQKTWTSSATRTVRIVVVGTSGRPRVDLDAFAVLR